MKRQFKYLRPKGFTILEVMVAIAILAISIVAAIHLYAMQQSQAAATKSGSSIGEIEVQVRSQVFARLKKYFALAPAFGCNDAAIQAGNGGVGFVGTMIPAASPGFQGNIGAYAIDSSNAPAIATAIGLQSHVSFQGARQQTLLSRCTAPTYANASGFGAANGFYFCLGLASISSLQTCVNTAGATGLYNCLAQSNRPFDPLLRQDDILNQQPLFAEFQFILQDSTTGANVTCNALTPPAGAYATATKQTQLVGVLYYTFHWNQDAVPSRIYNDYSGYLTLGGI